MSNQQVTLFQFENGAGPARALVAAGIDNSLGEGIRSSYAILSIKAGKWRIKYKGNEIPITRLNNDTGQMEPVATLEVVLVKANPFLNKQYYAGKYTEGSTSKPDCYSLDGKVPSTQVEHPQFSNCTMCPKNQFGSLIGDNGTKQKACRDTKKLAIVPLGDLRNESYGGPMLFRVPPSSLKDLSALADAMKARGYPYNSVAVRIGFDMDASHPKPTFKAIRPLSESEAEVVLELFQGDGVAAVLADNDVVAEVAQQAPVNDPGKFENEPVVGVGAQAPSAPRTPAQAPQAAPSPPPAQAPELTAAPEAPIQMRATQVAPPPPGMHGSVVQPFTPGGSPPPNPFDQPAAQAPVAAPKPKKVKPVVEMPAPQLVEPTAEPEGSQLGDDIGNILKGLSAFTGAK